MRTATAVSLLTLVLHGVGIAQETDSVDHGRRELRVAPYPYVPEGADLYWAMEREFEEKYPNVDLKYVDIGAYYYGGQLLETLESGSADVVEVDTVFLADLVTKDLIEALPRSSAMEGEFLEVAQTAVILDDELYGVPHWICGNFVFFRKDDPEASLLRAADSLDDLERILGRISRPEDGLLTDLRGSSTLGEKFFDALLDHYGDPKKAIQHANSTNLDADALASLDRLFALCPGGLCDSDKHHEYGEYYARQFGLRKARLLLGYSERLHFVVDEFLHGVRDGEPAVGQIRFAWNENTNAYDAIGNEDIDAVSAPLSDNGSHTLTWVDALAIRKGVTDQTRTDALAFIEFFNAHDFTVDRLVPEYGQAPRYLLPARASVYQDPTLLQAAPLYERFLEIKQSGNAVSAVGLADTLRAIGKRIETRGFERR